MKLGCLTSGALAVCSEGNAITQPMCVHVSNLVLLISSFYGVFSCPFGDALFNFCRLSIQPRHHLALGLTVFLLGGIWSLVSQYTCEDQKNFKRQKNELLIMKLEDIERALL